MSFVYNLKKLRGQYSVQIVSKSIIFDGDIKFNQSKHNIKTSNNQA